jgi:hypothetical protein
MHIKLELMLQAITPISVIALIYTVRNYHRQMNAQVFMNYTERYERILSEFPDDARDARFNVKVLPSPSPRLRLCVLKYLNLCSEEFYLMRNGYLDKTLWRIWEGDLTRMIGTPLLEREWQSLRPEFESHQEFLRYVDAIQSDCQRSKAAHA